ncbi:MAG: SDR family oxidoreductase [bacterium]
MKVLVTGANGFVGRRVCSSLKEGGYAVRAAVRDMNENGVDFIQQVIDDVICVGNIDGSTDWSRALDGVDVVMHLAARVHILQEVSKNPLESFRSVNVLGTGRLAKLAASAGVRRFVYISSISIHGNSTDERPYVEDDEANPHSPYAISKWEAEVVLRRIAQKSGLELVVVRPPLVYGPGVGGNFLRLMRWADKGWPLPLGSIHNLRSFIGIDNLADLIVRCVEHPDAAGETFLVADGEDLSTPDLIQRIAALLGRPARILPCPVGVLRKSAALFGMEDVVDRLCNSLQVSSEKARRVLGWQPSISLVDGFAGTAKWYADSCRRRK